MIIQVEYPKSGGTWLYKMLSYYLNVPVLPLLKSPGGKPLPGKIQDALMARREGCDGKNPFPSQQTFEYIAQTHELPKNAYFSPEHCTYFMVRDGRDVVVSYYFFQSRYHGAMKRKMSSLDLLKAGAGYWWDVLRGFRPYSRSINMTGKADLFGSYVSIRAAEWKQHVLAWRDQGKRFFRYEEFLRDTITAFRDILTFLGAEIDPALIEQTVSLMSFDNCRKLENGEPQDARFYRKGISGDWENHFSERQREIFKKVAGDALIELGYEKSFDW